MFKPHPIKEIDHPGKLAELEYPHDGMWAYKPCGLRFNIQILYDKYQKPYIVTENGVYSEDPQVSIHCLKDYLGLLHQMIHEGVPILGYIHWSTFEYFEWNLSPAYRFGLASVDLDRKDRSIYDAGKFYSNICEHSSVEI